MKEKFLGGCAIFSDTVRVLTKTFLRHPLRVMGRAAWLCGEFVLAALDYAKNVAFCNSELKHTQRGLWLQRNSRRVLRVAKVDWRADGPIPKHGLLVCNHLSYVDILVLAAITPALFVSKNEVRNWPVLGWFAKIAGTIFVRREKRSDVFRSTAEIKTALDNGSLLVLFPEGTSSNGETVLPFKSALLQPATNGAHALHVAHISYRLNDGDVVEEVYYWRDMTLFPHLLNLLGKRELSARVEFAPIAKSDVDRKELARRLHAGVMRLKTKQNH